MKQIQYIDPNLFVQKSAWDKLSLKEKADIIRVGIDNGLSNVSDIKKKYNEFAEGGEKEENLYKRGGTKPILDVKAGDKIDIQDCALFSNGVLRDNGYMISGNAWNLRGVNPIFNGFKGLDRPQEYDPELVRAYNHQAAQNVYDNFDSKTLDTSKPYVVNMFYNNSPMQQRAYNEGDNVTGTHTGLLLYDDDAKKWKVTHNIHGTIYQDDFIPLQSGEGKYGVTAIYSPRERTLMNRIKTKIGLAYGGPIVETANEFGKGGKKEELKPVWDSETQSYILPDVDVTAAPMSEFRKKWRRAMNMPIMVPATAPNPSSIASYQYNPSNLMQTTPKQEVDYLAGLAAPIAPYLTSAYFLGTGVGDMAENGINVGNSIQVGLSSLPFAPYVSKYAPAVVDKGLSLLGNKKAKIRNIGRTFEKSISDSYLEDPLNAWAIENAHTKVQTVPSIKDVNFNIETTLSPESPYYNWEVFVNNQNNRYDAAEKAVEEGKRLYTNLIESPEYLQRIKDNLRIDNLRSHYEYTKRNRPSNPNDYTWRHNEGDAIERFNTEYAERLEDSRIRDLKSTEAEEILKRIKGVNDQKRDIVLQDKIQYIDNNGNLVSPEGLAGMYLHNKETGARKIYLDVTVPDIAHTYMHEHGGHGTYRELSFLDFSDQFGRNLDMEPKIGLYDNGKWLTPKLVKYYKDFDEARARTIPVLAKMKNEGYKLSYNGFKKYLKDHNLNEGHLGLGYYDEKTIRHLINTIYGGTGIIIGASKFDNNLQTLNNKDE